MKRQGLFSLMTGLALCIWPAGSAWGLTQAHFYTFAGAAGQMGTIDGTGSGASFSILGQMTTDGAGNIYVSDNYSVRKITPSGVVTTVATFSACVNGIVIDDVNKDYYFSLADNTIVRLPMTGGWFMHGDGTYRAASYWWPTGEWEIKACGDYLGLGHAQVFYQRPDGLVALWQLDANGNFQSSTLLGNQSPWKLKAATDLDGNGYADLI